MVERFLIAGLGNPGKKYSNTRHNVGFQCVDSLAQKYNMTFDAKKGKAKIALGTAAGHAVLLAKPQTYMNLSGESIGTLANFYKIPPERILIIFDDLDLPVGTLRIRKTGGSSGQKGMKSIIQHLGTLDFNRIRFGIGRPPGRMDPAAYVLRPFDQGDEAILVQETIDRVQRAIEDWLNAGIDTAMNNHNGSWDDVIRRQQIAEEQQKRRLQRQQQAVKEAAASAPTDIPDHREKP